MDAPDLKAGSTAPSASGALDSSASMPASSTTTQRGEHTPVTGHRADDWSIRGAGLWLCDFVAVVMCL